MQMTLKNNQIAEFRKDYNLTQQQLAKEIGSNQRTISRWEKGLIEPSIMECWKLADYFNVSIDVLCGRREY